MYALYSGFKEIDNSIKAYLKKHQGSYFDEDSISSDKFVELGQKHFSFADPNAINTDILFRKANVDSNITFYQPVESYKNPNNLRRGKKRKLSPYVIISESAVDEDPVNRQDLGKRPRKEPNKYEPTLNRTINNIKKKKRTISAESDAEEAVEKETKEENGKGIETEKNSEGKGEDDKLSEEFKVYDLESLKLFCNEVRDKSAIIQALVTSDSTSDLRLETIFDSIMHRVYATPIILPASICSFCQVTNLEKNIIKCSDCDMKFCEEHLLHKKTNGHDFSHAETLIER
jgi:hypothetical protein